MNVTKKLPTTSDEKTWHGVCVCIYAGLFHFLENCTSVISSIHIIVLL